MSSTLSTKTAIALYRDGLSITITTDEQIAANQLNAAKSSGKLICILAAFLMCAFVVSFIPG